MSVLALVGPTGSGKTALSIPVAERLNGEIISADSRQLYRGMDIGTDKIGEPERSAIPHHGLDLVPPSERFSAGRWARAARDWIAAIEGRGRQPIVVGGTGFFLKALAEPIFREPPMDDEARDALRSYLADRSVEELGRWVDRLDPERAEVARAGGAQRISRTLEVALLSGRSLSWWHANAPVEGRPVPLRIALLTLPREELYRRINSRAERMFERGLLDEVAGLLDEGFSVKDPGMTGTGYREAAAVLTGELTRSEAIDRVQKATRAYARRQITWFRHQLPSKPLEIDSMVPLEEQVERVVEWWEGRAAPTSQGTEDAQQG